MKNLVEVDDDPEDVADDKDHYDSHKYHGDTQVSLLSVAGPHVSRRALGDGPVEHAVNRS